MLGKLLRRVHMYLALALAPWVAVYAFSTMAMNHRAWLQPGPAGASARWTPESATTFAGVLPEGDNEAAAAVLLASLDLEGAHSVSTRSSDGALVIQRQDILRPRRITYTPADNRLVVEVSPFRPTQFLERAHRRRGFQQAYQADDIWAFSVDAVIVAMLFWVVSGVWLWWELKSTRVIGSVALGGGVLLFALYLAIL